MQKKVTEILPNASNKTTNASNETTSATNAATTPATTTRSNDTYVHGVGMIAVLAIGACVFFAYNTFQPKNKKLVNDRLAAQHEQKQDQPPTRRRML